MTRSLSRCFLTLLAVMTAGVLPASAQLALAPLPAPARLLAAPSSDAVQGELHGVVNDERGGPLSGAVVSALGETTVFAVSDRDGRFAFRALPAGAYLVRVHLQGYLPARGRVVQVVAGGRQATTIALLRRSSSSPETLEVLEAGVGASEAVAADDESEAEHGHDEVAWRMRHLKRSVLKDAQAAVAELDEDGSLMGESLTSLGRAFEGSARIASALFADLPLTGQVNLLTTASFHRPQDLFAMDAGVPRGVAYVSLAAPGPQGDWRVRGTITQGDVSSWILAAGYVRNASAAHRYEAGVSYATQRYLGGNTEALAAIREGGRNVGSMYAYDDWTVNPRVRFSYGGKYASYDYLEDRGLISPRVSVTVEPFADQHRVKLRATASHGEIAPGAEEFLPPSVGLWLPPERTFSHVTRGRFVPERVNHFEVAVERELQGDVVIGVRAFRQRVEDQLVTLFGAAVTEPSAAVGHYQVGSAGDFGAGGWGISVSRTVTDGVRASVDYTLVHSEWRRPSVDALALAQLTVPVLIPEDKRIHDVTASLESVVAATATRLFVLYRINNGFAHDVPPLASARFTVQVNQALPFLNFANAQWEMLGAVSNLFREEAIDASVYDELLVVSPPKRVLGGVTVRF
jgi:hypothetical protein